jgi:hypothetical protein
LQEQGAMLFFAPLGLNSAFLNRVWRFLARFWATRTNKLLFLFRLSATAKLFRISLFGAKLSLKRYKRRPFLSRWLKKAQVTISSLFDA